MRSDATGFSLIEMAIVLVVLGVLATGTISALRLQAIRSHTLETREAIEDAREALYEHAVIKGYLPCPAKDDGGLSGPCPSNTDANTRAAIAGFVPWKELGITGQDAWGRRLRYAVSNALLPPGIPSLAAGLNSDLSVKDGDTRLSSTGTVAFVLWSPGEDGEEATTIPLNNYTVQAHGDDIVIWASRFILMGRLMQGGRLLPLK